MKLAIGLGVASIVGYILVRELRRETELRKQQRLVVGIRRAHLTEIVELYSEIIWEEE